MCAQLSEKNNFCTPWKLIGLLNVADDSQLTLCNDYLFVTFTFHSIICFETVKTEVVSIVTYMQHYDWETCYY